MGEMEFKIVSGGQTGIDQAALAAAVAAEVPYGGWVPKGRRTEAGTLDAKYTAMQEMPTDDYRKRTRQNVVDSDVTLILTRGEPEGGTLQTIEFCKQHQKPYRVYDLAQNVADLLPPHWVVELLIELVNEIGKDGPVINVAGPRESKCPGIQDEATGILTNAFKIAKHTERQPDGKYQSFLLYLERMMPAGLESMQHKDGKPDGPQTAEAKKKVRAIERQVFDERMAKYDENIDKILRIPEKQAYNNKGKGKARG